jgi:tRNA/tmRNA/rRNA uracil-C5-methylase (TrmA/RlmC/RlmD family)
MCRLPDGSVGFVEGAYPGDVVRPLDLVRKRDFTRVTRFELVQPSPDRVHAACPVVDACGGCDWMKLERSVELREKGRLVAQALERTGGVRLAALPEVVTAGAELGYRSRVRLHVDERGRVGFFSRGTHRLVEVPGCPVAEPEVERGIACVRGVAEDSPGAIERFESIEVRLRAEGGLAFLAFLREASRTGTRSAEHLVLERLRAHGSATLGRAGAEFSQVNRAVNDLLVERVVAGARARKLETFVDLYAGSGNFGVPLARAGMRGVCVERDRSSVARARERASRESLELSAIAADTVTGLAELRRSRRACDLVVLDPPRAGAKEAVAGIVALEPRVIAYVACDPVTLARDLRAFGASGFGVAAVTCFDMFPRTHHVETLAWLERG